MIVDEVIIKIIGKAEVAFPGIDAQKLRAMLEETLYDYEIQPKSEALVPMSDIYGKIKMYVAVKKLDGLSDKTLKNYWHHLIRLAGFIKKSIKDITTMDIRMYLAYLLKNNHLKDTTLETEKSILKSFFNWLEDEEYITKSPARKIKATKIGKRLRKALDEEELERLRDACRTPRQRAMLEFIFSTGCRVSEVTDVNIADLNWSECSLKVIGKGNKEREVQFSKKARLYLRKCLASRGDISSQALFVSQKKPYMRLSTRAIEKEIHKIAEQAKMDKPVYPHLLRHTMATLGLRSGMPLQTVQKLLGHSDPKTTEIYAELSDESAKEEYRKHMVQ